MNQNSSLSYLSNISRPYISPTPITPISNYKINSSRQDDLQFTNSQFQSPYTQRLSYKTNLSEFQPFKHQNYDMESLLKSTSIPKHKQYQYFQQNTTNEPNYVSKTHQIYQNSFNPDIPQLLNLEDPYYIDLMNHMSQFIDRHVPDKNEQEVKKEVTKIVHFLNTFLDQSEGGMQEHRKRLNTEPSVQESMTEYFQESQKGLEDGVQLNREDEFTQNDKQYNQQSYQQDRNNGDLNKQYAFQNYETQRTDSDVNKQSEKNWNMSDQCVSLEQDGLVWNILDQLNKYPNSYDQVRENYNNKNGYDNTQEVQSSSAIPNTSKKSINDEIRELIESQKQIANKNFKLFYGQQ